MSSPNRSHPDYTTIIGSSDLGRCVRASCAELQGYTPLPPDARMQALYDAGHEHEDLCIAAMNGDGWHLPEEDRQQEFIIDCGDGVGVIVHPDAIAHVDAGSYYDPLPWSERVKVIEVKSPSTWASFERAVRTRTFTDAYMDRIAWQVSCQMVATGLEAVVACLDDSGLRTFGVETPIYTEAEIVSRARAIANVKTLPLCDKADYPCPFVYLHPPKETETEADPVLDELVETYDFFSAQAKALEEKKATARQQILDYLGPRAKAETASVKVTRFSTERRTLDRARVAEAGIDLSPFETVKVSESVKITVKGAKSEVD